MSEATRVLAQGTLRYLGARNGGATVDWMTARVFVLDYSPPFGGGDAFCTVVAREPMFLPYHRVPAPVGSIHSMLAYEPDDDDLQGYKGQGDLLTLDVDALVLA